MDGNTAQTPPQEPVFYTRPNNSSPNFFDKFSSFFTKKTIVGLVILILVIGVGAATIAVQRSTEIRQRAATPTAPQFTPGDPFPILDIPKSSINPDGTVRDVPPALRRQVCLERSGVWIPDREVCLLVTPRAPEPALSRGDVRDMVRALRPEIAAALTPLITVMPPAQQFGAGETFATREEIADYLAGVIVEEAIEPIDDTWRERFPEGVEFWRRGKTAIVAARGRSWEESVAKVNTIPFPPSAIILPVGGSRRGIVRVTGNMDRAAAATAVGILFHRLFRSLELPVDETEFVSLIRDWMAAWAPYLTDRLSTEQLIPRNPYLLRTLLSQGRVPILPPLPAHGVTAIPTPTPTTPPGVTVPPAKTVSPTSIPQPTIPAGSTVLALTIGLDGIGNTGDNSNPKRLTRNLTVEIFDNSNNQAVGTAKTGSATYNAGIFTGNVDLGPGFTTGTYNIKVKSDGYLRRQILGVTLTAGQTNTAPPISLFAGDIDGDNRLTINDYNILISCSIFSTDNQGLCNSNNQYKILSDLDDNGVINQLDYNLFVRELSVQNGD